jgi:uncharacterized protein YciI
MEFFCYHRDRPGSVALHDELLEQHWAYMDQYAKEMIARGPTFADDGDTPTGSVHIVDLPDPVAARAFAFDEPNYQAGAYRDVLLRRWRNTLGRTMRDFPGGRAGGNRFAALGLEILWNKPAGQVTVFAEITENTLQAIPGITDPSQDGVPRHPHPARRRQPRPDVGSEQHQ